MDPPLYIIDPRVWSCLTLSQTSLCAPQGHISELLSCCDHQEHFEQHLFCLQPHLTRYVVNVESHFRVHVGTLGKSFTRRCLWFFVVLTPTQYQCFSRKRI